MKIVSRPSPTADITVGSGNINLKMTPEQVELIAAFVWQCRLGSKSPYSVAAFDLLNLIEDEFGSDFVEDSGNIVDLQVTVEDGNGSVVFSSTSGVDHITFEV